MLPSLALTAALAALARAMPAEAPSSSVISPATSTLNLTEPIPTLHPCATIKCTATTQCVVVRGRGTCQPIKRQQCGDVLCPSGTECCNALCGICVQPGMMCVMGCAAKTNPTVVALRPVARRADAAPPAVSDISKSKATCGKNVCAEDEECCNSSCGTCVKKGGFCTQQFCTEEPDVIEPPKETPKIEPLKPSIGQKCGRNVCGKGQFCCNSSCSQCAPLGGACTMQFCGHVSY